MAPGGGLSSEDRLLRGSGLSHRRSSGWRQRRREKETGESQQAEDSKECANCPEYFFFLVAIKYTEQNSPCGHS